METNSSHFTFKVDNVEVNESLPRPLITAEISLKQLGIKEKQEDFSHRNQNENVFIYQGITGFMAALHGAYRSHYRLKLSVSDFILLIGQGLGKHIEKNAEKLRKYFVNHEGKKEIVIIRDNFVKGQQNDWSTVFGEFAEAIKNRVKTDIHGIVVDDTSVATPTSRIASEITLMNCMKDYFSYKVISLCGIPEITLVGSKEDWENLRGKVRRLSEMNKDDCLDLDWWLSKLTPVVEKICDNAIKKEIDQEFWSDIYKHHSGGSGTSYITGWITDFFPYLVSGRNDFKREIDTPKIPAQFCTVPFIWQILGTEIPMNFHGGFIGAKYNKEDKSVEPVHFWSVTYQNEK